MVIMDTKFLEDEDIFLRLCKLLPFRTSLALFQTCRSFRYFVKNYWSRQRVVDVNHFTAEYIIYAAWVLKITPSISERKVPFLLNWLAEYFPNTREIIFSCELLTAEIVSCLRRFQKLESVHLVAACTTSLGNLLELIEILENRLCSLTFENISLFSGTNSNTCNYGCLFGSAWRLRAFRCACTSLATDLLCANLVFPEKLAVLSVKIHKLELLNAFLPKCFNLVSLEVRRVEFLSGSASARVEESELLSIIGNLSKLETLTLALSALSKLPETFVRQFFETKGRLKELTLEFFPAGNKNLVHVCIDALSRFCPDLEKLHIFDLEPQPCHLLFEFIGRLRKLKDLKLNVSSWETELEEDWHQNLVLAPIQYLWFQITRQEVGHLFAIPYGLEKFRYLQQLTIALCENLNLRPNFAEFLAFATTLPPSLSVLQLVGVVTCEELELMTNCLGSQLRSLLVETLSSTETNKSVKIAGKSPSLNRFSLRNFQVWNGAEKEELWRWFVINVINKWESLKYLELPQELFVRSLSYLANRELVISFPKTQWPLLDVHYS